MALVASFWLAPSVAFACAACGFGEDESRQAYIGTTIFMSVTPVFVILGFAFFVARKIKKHDDAQPRPGERAPVRVRPTD